MSNKQPSPFQIRAAMCGLNWEYKDLSRASGLTVDALSRICLEKHEATERSRDKIRKAFELEGIEFTDNDGIRRRPHSIDVFEGPEDFSKFYDFVYEYLSQNGGDVCIGGSDARDYSKFRTNPEIHRKRMTELVKMRNDVTVRILAQEGDYNFVASSYAQYRWQPKEYFTPTTFYAFGNCLALISFLGNPAPYVVLHRSGPFAEAYRQAFNLSWERAIVPPPKKEEAQ